MNGLVLLLISAGVLAAAYLLYGRRIARLWGVDPTAPTPAHAQEDGVDYVPTKRSVVFGHQFASIAGAGPINGPIIAAMFGWLPVLLWILVGGVFIGALHDFAAMYASVKNRGKTIGYLIELYIGRAGKRLFLLFVWLFSILVIAAFADIVAKTFDGYAGPEGAMTAANAAVASTSVLFIAAAVSLGFFLRRVKPGGLVSAVAAVAALTVCIALGMAFPWFASREFWLYFVFVYVFAASVLPVWALLQPRDYLNAFLLVAMMAAAFVGVVCAAPPMNLPAFNGFVVNGLPIFPILFVTVACGAVSGFHSLVASGTASKQIENERDMLPVSFGGMLLECLLGVLALVAVGAVAVDGVLPGDAPPMVFARAVSGFLTGIGLPAETTYTLVTLAISAFALTSLDSVGRVGRLALQELFVDEPGVDSDKLDSAATVAVDRRASPLGRLLANRYAATAVTLFMGWFLAQRGYESIWPLFGSSNQLLAALSLLACAVFLKRTKRRGTMLYVPMAFMLLVTFSALGLTIYALIRELAGGGFDEPVADTLQLVFGLLLLGLGLVVAAAGLRRLKGKAVGCG